MPILDESPVAGLFVAAGMSGHGFKLAPAVGEMMAARITGATPPVSLAPFRLGPLRRRRRSAGLSCPRTSADRGTAPS